MTTTLPLHAIVKMALQQSSRAKFLSAWVLRGKRLGRSSGIVASAFLAVNKSAGMDCFFWA